MTTSEPFGAGSVSIGLYAQGDDAVAIVADLRVQAHTVGANGFDGLTLAEHHGGSESYLPNPGQAIGWLLSESERLWGAACPVLLPLRSPGLVIEEMAWLAARFPGRVGAGFAPGFVPADFEIAGTAIHDRNARYAQELPTVVGALSGRSLGPISADWAVRLTAVAPIPTVSAAGGPVGARRAAQAGSGIVTGAFNTIAKTRGLLETYAAAGGVGARLLIRRAWLGTVPAETMRRLAAQHQKVGATFLPSDPEAELLVSDPDPIALAQRLAEATIASGANALSLRFSLPGIPQQATLEQIERVGQEVLPRLREGLASLTAAGSR